MNILVLTPRFPYPPLQGDQLRVWAEIEHLACDHRVWLASATNEAPAPEARAHVQTICEDVAVAPRSTWRALVSGALSLFSGESLTAGYFARPALIRQIRRWQATHQFDALLTYASGMAPTSAHVIARRRVLDICDVDSVKWQRYADVALPPVRWLLGLESRRLAQLETHWVRAHDVTCVVTERERRKLRHLAPQAQIEVLRAAIDLNPYRALADAPLPTAPIMGTVGSMFYRPNVEGVLWFAKRVWPLIRASSPNAEWRIIGQRPRRAIRKLAKEPGITVTGRVPDVCDELAQLRVFVNPTRGDLGVQTKQIVALAAGRASVVTPDVAAGIDHDDPPPFRVADGPTTFAEAVMELLECDSSAKALAQRARTTAERVYDADLELSRLAALLSPPRIAPLAPSSEPHRIARDATTRVEEAAQSSAALESTPAAMTEVRS